MPMQTERDACMPHELLAILLPFPHPTDTLSVGQLAVPPDPVLYEAWAAPCVATGWPATRSSALVIWVPVLGVAEQAGLGLSSAVSLTDRVPRIADLFAPPVAKMRWQTRRVPLGGDAFGAWVPWALWTRSGILGLAAEDLTPVVPPVGTARRIQWHRGTTRLMGGHSA